MNKFENCELEVISFEAQDVITTSGGFDGGALDPIPNSPFDSQQLIF